MSREDFVVVAVRLFAIFLFVLGLRIAGTAFAGQAEDESWETLAIILAFTALPMVLAAALLWYFPLSVSRKLLPVLKHPLPPLTADGRVLEETGVTLIGLWLLAVALSEALYWSSFIMMASQLDHQTFELSPENKASALFAVGQLAIGVWLMLGSRGIVGAIRRFRSAGV